MLVYVKDYVHSLHNTELTITLCHIKPCILEKKFKALIYQMNLRIDLKKKPFKIFVNGKHIRGKKECEGGGVRI